VRCSCGRTGSSVCPNPAEYTSRKLVVWLSKTRRPSIPDSAFEAGLVPLARMAMSLFDRWKLSSEDEAFLLGRYPITAQHGPAT
jgi:hypothetical protein